MRGTHSLMGTDFCQSRGRFKEIHLVRLPWLKEGPHISCPVILHNDQGLGRSKWTLEVHSSHLWTGPNRTAFSFISVVKILSPLKGKTQLKKKPGKNPANEC